jgi:hypothetical protein
MNERGRLFEFSTNNPNEDLEKMDIEFSESLNISRSKSLTTQSPGKKLFDQFEIVKKESDDEEIANMDFELEMNDLDSTSKNSYSYSNRQPIKYFYKIHHKNKLPITKITPNEDLISSKDIPIKLSRKNTCRQSVCSNTTFDTVEEEKIDNKNEALINFEHSPRVKLLTDNMEDNILLDLTQGESSILNNVNNNIHINHNYNDEFDVIKEDNNENEN